ncbi:MAG TPA: hypothetical protein VLM79_02660 [Kofleriaceae bacterium]|nr:hypothetical protein [Kofleriaceae bacterium]
MTGAWHVSSFGIALGLSFSLAGCEEGGETSPDAGVQARCSPTAMFGRRTTVASLSSPNNEEQAALSPDELTMFFSRDDGNGAFDIFEAKRASATGAFDSGTPVPGVNTSAEERAPRVTADGLTMYATTRATPNGQFRVAAATRASTDGMFGALQPVPGINGTTNDSDPWISADGRVLYFSSDRTGNYGLYRSTQTGGVFSAPELVRGTNLDTPYMELAPVLTEDELTLYFASSRPNLGSVDVFEATRATAQDPFGEPVNLTEINGVNGDVPSWVSADNCQLYVTHFDPTLNLEIITAFRGK